MKLIDWDLSKAHLDVVPEIEDSDKQDMLFMLIGGATKDLGWVADLNRAPSRKGDCKMGYWASLRPMYLTYKGIRVTVGFNPHATRGLPKDVVLSELDPNDYPVFIKSEHTTEMSQKQMFIMSFAIKEAVSLLQQLHVVAD